MVEATEQETWGDMVRRVASDFDHEPTDGEIEFVLWERTAFPLDTPERTERMVREFYERDR